MDRPHLEMEEVTIEFEEEALEQIDEIAFTDHRGHREAAIRSLLDAWLKNRDE